MPTPQGTAAANAQTTDEAWLILLALDHPSFATPIRVARNKINVVHGGNTYVRFPFNLKLPGKKADEKAVGMIEIDNIGEFEIDGKQQTIGDVVKAIPVGENAVATVTIVLGSDPELIEEGPASFTLRNVKDNGLTVTGELHMEDFRGEPCPCDSMPA